MSLILGFSDIYRYMLVLATGPTDTSSNLRCDRFAGSSERIGCEMGIAVRGLGLRMTKKCPDRRQRHATCGAHRGKGMAKIVKAHIIQPCCFPDPAPWLLQVDQPHPLPLADNHEGIAFHSGKLTQNGQSRCIEIKRLGARLAVREPDRGALEIDELPLER